MADGTCPKCGLTGVQSDTKPHYIMHPPSNGTGPFGSAEPLQIHIIDGIDCLKRQLATERTAREAAEQALADLLATQAELQRATIDKLIHEERQRDEARAACARERQMAYEAIDDAKAVFSDSPSRSVAERNVIGYIENQLAFIQSRCESPGKAILDELAAKDKRIGELEAAMVNWPKTADGVAIHPEQVVWPRGDLWMEDEQGARIDFVLKDIATGDDGDLLPSYVYSTRAAAMSAARLLVTPLSLRPLCPLW